ncbi:MAG: TOBE domain-containing protein [Acidimicrobiales bacterium]
MAALDVRTRSEVRRELARHLGTFGGIRILVTHDPLDALALADRLLILEEGRVVQVGRPSDITGEPRSDYVAELVGTNLFRGTVRAGHLLLGNGAALAAVSPVVGEAFAVVHPRAVALHTQRPAGSPRNVWPGVVGHVDLVGDRVRVRVGGPVPIVAEVTPEARVDLGLARGAEVWVSVKATEVVVYPA